MYPVLTDKIGSSDRSGRDYTQAHKVSSVDNLSLRLVVWTDMASLMSHSSSQTKTHHMSAAPVIGLNAITSGAVDTRKERISVS